MPELSVCVQTNMPILYARPLYCSSNFSVCDSHKQTDVLDSETKCFICKGRPHSTELSSRIKLASWEVHSNAQQKQGSLFPWDKKYTKQSISQVLSWIDQFIKGQACHREGLCHLWGYNFKTQTKSFYWIWINIHIHSTWTLFLQDV